jgi:serine/threonine protein kinase
VIHRDLKPENVMVGELGEALVMDWGLAKELGTGSLEGSAQATPSDAVADTLPADGGATVEGTVMGTPAYMAPEQARGDVASLDARTDVYALGASLYAVLAKRPPFLPRKGRSLLDDVIEAEPTPLRELDASIPAPVESIVRRAMAKEPAKRYASAGALSDDLDRFLDAEPVSAHRESVVERLVRFASRHRVLLSLFLAYLVLRLVLAAFAR